MCFSSTDAVDHLLYLVKFLLRQILPFCKCGDKGRQRPLEFFLDQVVNLAGLRLILGNKRGHNTVFVFQNSALTKPLDDRVGCRSLPAQLLQAKLCKLRCRDRLMLP